jgi:hypothetical protein
MSKRLYPHKCVRYWYAYDIEEICALFADLGLHEQTVRKWVKNGLKTIDAGKPMLIYGQHLIDYLKRNNNANKCETPFDKLYCFSCQDARAIFKRQIHVDHKGQYLNVKGVCSECKKGMNKGYKLADFSRLKKIFILADVSELYDCANSPDKTQIHAQDKQPVSESLLSDLFL